MKLTTHEKELLEQVHCVLFAAHCNNATENILSDNEVHESLELLYKLIME